MESLRDKRRRPTHPGEILREMVLPDLGITQAEFAKKLGVSRRSVSQLVNEHRPVTPDMAIRLAKLIGSTPDFWLRLQAVLDIWEAKQANGIKYSKIKSLVSPQDRKVG